MNNTALHPKQQAAEYDFIIVGSGAGGGPLACNLAKNGFRVLVLEAGGWDAPEVAQVPAFHTHASEHPDLSWEFFVKHYAKPEERDSKWDEIRNGIFYPRAATVGGCTFHNAMITICGPSGDWDEIAKITNDDSWSGERMRAYFERLEHCDYVSCPASKDDSLLAKIWSKIAGLLGIAGNAGRHGFDGWLHTTVADPKLGLEDRQLNEEILSALVATLVDQGVGAIATIESFLSDLFGHQAKARFDPNNWETMKRRPEGLMLIPIAVRDGQRSSPRDYLIEMQKKYPERLIIQTETLVTEIIFDREPGAAGEPAAIGVRFLRGKHLYNAHPQPSNASGTSGEVFCRREVVLCGGVYNTPQLLKLSGIGPRTELEAFQIPVRVDLPGVGTNLQDRYEIGVISEAKEDFELLKDLAMGIPAPGEQPDPALKEWRERKTGLYTSNAIIIGLLKKSRRDLPAPDLFIFAVPGFFKGYYKGYSLDRANPDLATRHNLLTWLVMKAHTKNRAGTVKLRSANPLDVPEINFHYFYEGTDRDTGEDLEAIVEGFKFARTINEIARKRGVVKREIWPGPEENVEDEDSIRRFVAKEAWGHHASCSCPIGAEHDPMAVLDSRFRVRGVRNLRVVDASVFPRIPGVFIATNIYMISEKASDVITEDNNNRRKNR
jgi:Choline dehydrogenase and related flavoproteins